jgi:hypothetical protein
MPLQRLSHWSLTPSWSSSLAVPCARRERPWPAARAPRDRHWSAAAVPRRRRSHLADAHSLRSKKASPPGLTKTRRGRNLDTKTKKRARRWRQVAAPQMAMHRPKAVAEAPVAEACGAGARAAPAARAGQANAAMAVAVYARLLRLRPLFPRGQWQRQLQPLALVGCLIQSRTLETQSRAISTCRSRQTQPLPILMERRRPPFERTNRR